MAETFMNQDRVSELWTAIKTALGQKADKSELSGYTTPDAVATAITSALADYATTAGVATQIATALVNYMTKSEVEDAIIDAVADAIGITFETVDTLPETGETNVIYFVPNNQSGNNVKDEYMWIDDKWELIGSTAITLKGYWSKTELTAMTAEELQAILV